METFEHTKCKPVSIALAVDAENRKILGVEVASMPAKGLLAKTSRKKYGLRKDDRRKALGHVLQQIGKVISKDGVISSDCCPRYPRLIKKHLPLVIHITFEGKRGCIVGQGELKATGRDPLFALNHTAAMIRDDLKRLSRRTWCTTKKLTYLSDLLIIYTHYRNEKLISQAK